ncbi:MAG: hypothetical protein MHM6MM_003516 [Cercozoa sp. M6MM]
MQQESSDSERSSAPPPKRQKLMTDVSVRESPLLKAFSKGKQPKGRQGKSCHVCKRLRPLVVWCQSTRLEGGGKCLKKFCTRCITAHLKSSEPPVVTEEDCDRLERENWRCYACRNMCSCTHCRRKREKAATEQQKPQTSSVLSKDVKPAPDSRKPRQRRVKQRKVWRMPEPLNGDLMSSVPEVPYKRAQRRSQELQNLRQTVQDQSKVIRRLQERCEAAEQNMQLCRDALSLVIGEEQAQKIDVSTLPSRISAIQFVRRVVTNSREVETPPSAPLDALFVAADYLYRRDHTLHDAAILAHATQIVRHMPATANSDSVGHMDAGTGAGTGTDTHTGPTLEDATVGTVTHENRDSAGDSTTGAE